MLVEERHRAKILRAKGYSLKEIAEKLDVAKSSVSFWVRDIVLSPAAEKRLLGIIKKGQFIAARNKKERTRKKEEVFLGKALSDLSSLKIDDDYARLICAIIYWCEGVKNPSSGISFINSDPKLMKSFVNLFRQSFNLKEEKFRPQLHLHSYHIVSKEVDFWSKVINIRSSQFVKPYIKPHSGKRFREGYRGCMSLRYYDANLARQLLAFGRAFFQKYNSGA